ncbi:MAG: flagellar protein FlaG [Sulfurimonadaceae bacterium]|jgi:flagellar protein FlaG|nr:flagellar protein FlaG [Sulfurimonadaceae bacterium]
MDGIANVARMQQTQITQQQSGGELKSTQRVEQMESARLENEKNNELKTPQINSQEELEKLIDELNEAISPFNTSLRFGVDRQDIFYVSVIDSKSDRMIRRYPAEEALEFLPKMRDVSGILFNSKG